MEAADLGITLGLEVINRYETNVLNTAVQVSHRCSHFWPQHASFPPFTAGIAGCLPVVMCCTALAPSPTVVIARCNTLNVLHADQF